MVRVSESGVSHDALVDRVKYLLESRWKGNQRQMAADIGLSQALISKVVNGSQGVGRRMIDRLIGVGKVDQKWLFSGYGAPFPPLIGTGLPIAQVILPGPPAESSHLLSGLRYPVAEEFERPTRYWLELSEDLLQGAPPALKLAVGDLLLVETESSWIERPELAVGQLACYVCGSTSRQFRLFLLSSASSAPRLTLVGVCLSLVRQRLGLGGKTSN